MTYVTIFRCFLDFMYVKIIKDYFLTQQTERSTYSRRIAVCRTLQAFRRPLNKIQKIPTKITWKTPIN